MYFIFLLVQVTDFCKTSGREHLYHDPYRPTKHNLICNGKSVCEVIDQHEDFQYLSPLDLDNSPDTEFNILTPEEGRYVMVLDISSSMGSNKVGRPRITRLKEVSINFVKYYVKDGSKVGVVHFR